MPRSMYVKWRAPYTVPNETLFKKRPVRALFRLLLCKRQYFISLPAQTVDQSGKKRRIV